MNNLTTAKIRRCREAFDLYDQNKDGTIKKSDLLPVMRSLRYDPSESDIQNYLTTMCFDKFEKSERIAFEEFMKVIATNLNEFDVDDEEVFSSFSELDKDKTGKLKIEDFRKYLKLIKHNLKEEELDELFSEIDPYSTGEIDYYKLLNKEHNIVNIKNNEILND
jgi:calmodulin